MIEEWRDIKGYEGLYQVSNMGRVQRLDKYIVDVSQGGIRTRMFKGHIMNLTIHNVSGYVSMYLSKNGKKKRYLVHRLVAEAFIPNPDNLPEINHKDENKVNNCVENLEWCTPKYNANYGERNYKAGLSKIKCEPHLVVDVYSAFVSGLKPSAVKEKFQVSDDVARRIRYRRGVYGDILSRAGI